MNDPQQRALALERAVKSLIMGELTPGSGSKSIKGDARSERFHVEAKYRSGIDGDANWLWFEVEWLETLFNQADRERRIPVLALEFESGRRLLLLPAGDWEALTGESAGDLPVARPGRRLRFFWPETAMLYDFPAIEVPAAEWIGLHWSAFADLRRLAQPKKESRGFRRTAPGSGRSPRALRGGRPLGGQSFRRRPKE